MTYFKEVPVSYSIEYNSTIYVDTRAGDKTYYLFQRIGDNNVWEADNKSRMKEWYFMQSGSEGELWKYLGSIAGSVEGGDPQKAVGWTDTRYFTIEEYIARYRSKIRNAKPLPTLFDAFQLVVTVYPREAFVTTDDETVARLREAIQTYDLEAREIRRWSTDDAKPAFQGALLTVEGLQTFLREIPRNHAHYWIEISVDKWPSAAPRRRRSW